jgi:hypothetical protein
MEEIATVEEIEKKYKDEWVIIEVLEVNELEEPIKGKLIAHSKSRDEIYDLLKDKTGDFSVFFTGEIPKKGYAVAF